MELILLVGLPGSGKSTYYKEHFFNSHVRISNDLLKTKNRTAKLLNYCLETEMSFVVDNTNTTAVARRQFIQACDEANINRKDPIKKICIWFDCPVATCLKRNDERKEKDKVPKLAILGKAKEFESPTTEEGFDEIRKVEF